MPDPLSPLISYQPSSTAAYCTGDAVSAIVRPLLVELRQNEGAPSPTMIALSEANPYVLARIVADGFGKRVVAQCSANANACARVVGGDHLIECEEVAMTSDEGKEILIRSARANLLKLRDVEEHYAELIKDPNRLVRIGYHELAEKFLAERPSDPLSAFYVWWKQPGVELSVPVALPEEYVYRSALRVRASGGTPDVRGITSPRWAFHCLRDGLVEDSAMIGQLHDLLHQSPAWTADYCEQAGLDALRTRAHLERTSSSNAEWLLLDPWFGEFVREKLTR